MSTTNSNGTASDTGTNKGNSNTGTDHGYSDTHHSHIKVLVGTVVHSTRDDPMIILPNTVLGVYGSKIRFMGEARRLRELQTQYGFSDSDLIFLTDSQFVMPGLVDTHTHASQWPNNGAKLDLTVVEWLQTYTYPTEATFSDPKIASEVYRRVVHQTLSHGTTTAAYNATRHLESTKLLADTVAGMGQRALVGKVNFTRGCDERYREASVEESIRDTEEFVSYVKSLQNPLVSAIVTPRSAFCCPPELLAGLGEIAARHDLPVQTHMRECKSQVSKLYTVFPSATSCSNVIQNAGLMSHKTILAHCIWLEEEDLEILASTGAGVSHCPNSNLSLRSGLCDVRRLLDRGIKVALGTDCSGGYSCSMLDAIRCALHVSRVLAILEPEYQHLTLQETFRLATLGGAQVVDMEDHIGNFEVGKDFDALLIDVEAPGSSLHIYNRDTTKEQIEKFLYNGDDRNIVQVFVAGQCVVQN